MRKMYPYLLILIIVLLPLIIGKLIVSKSPIDLGNIAGSESDWLLFWATYIGASATAIMAWLTYKMFRQNKDLLDAQKLRWETERRGILSFSVVSIKDLFCLEVQNIGLSVTTDITFSFNGEFLDCFPKKEISEYLVSVGNNPSRLVPSSLKDYPIFPNNSEHSHIILGIPMENNLVKETIEKLKNVQIEIKGSYKTIDKEYEINEKFKISSFLTKAIIHEDDIEKELKSITKELEAINGTIKAK
ncbi:MAG: hypothetical protein LLF93_09995 [Bacteroidales bacterium]|nr:hypothetical protein [Bacteroidales bacterium]